jgi:hypothetical protein
MPRAGAITFLGALGITLLTPVIVLAGLLALVGLAAGGTLRLVLRTPSRPGTAGDAAEGWIHEPRFAPVLHLDLDDTPADITLRPAA